MGDAFDRQQNEPRLPLGVDPHSPKNDVSPPLHRSMVPIPTPLVNETHPYPDYIKKFSDGGFFPKHYEELLKVPPVDKVRSKVFDEKQFLNTHRIGVVNFQDKTMPPFEDKQAGTTVSKQISKELQRINKYNVIPPDRKGADARLKIIAGTRGGKPEDLEPPGEKKSPEALPGIPYSYGETDAVLIGAVTKFMDSYVDRRGQLRESISSGVEFGAYLVSTKTGDVIWGALYMESQPIGISNLFQDRLKWLKKEELSQSAMKRVLKEFHVTRNIK